MKLHSFLIWLVVLSFAGFANAQSLAELAKKEKERRKKNKDSESKVITESDLSRVKSPAFSSTAVPSSSGSASAGASRAEGSPGAEAEAGTEGQRDEVTTPATIPSDAPLQDKISLFEQMVKAHRAEIQKIDEEIAKNNARIQEIQQQLASIGGTGLPTAPRADRTPRYEGQTPALRSEQQELRQKNQQLQAQKTSKANALRETGRRAGIPAGYLRF